MIGYAVQPMDALASYRFRIDIPRRWMSIPSGFGIGRVTVCPKHIVPLNVVRAIKEKSIVVWDVSDDHWDNPNVAEYYREMPRLADYITCTTDTLRKRVQGRVTVITDPLEFERQPPRVGAEKFLWYGHSTNLKAALEVLHRIKGEVRIITNAPGFIPYSPTAMQEGLEWCDAVVIPVKKDGIPRWDGKSPNRMTEAINAGRYVIANPMPAYSRYGMWQGDILEGVEWLRNNQDKALQAVKAAQPLVWDLHNPRTVAKEWESLFVSILDAARESGRAT